MTAEFVLPGDRLSACGATLPDGIVGGGAVSGGRLVTTGTPLRSDGTGCWR